MSFPAYPEYKDSGVEWLGEVPAGWTVDRLKWHLVETDTRVGDEPTELLGLSKTLGVQLRSDITQGASEATSYEKYKTVNRGDLIMNKMQAWNGVFGLSSCDGMKSPDYSTFRIREGVEPVYLAYLLRTDIAAGEFFRHCKGMGTAFLRLNTSDFFDVEVAWPSKNEQRTIAAFLDRETAKIDAAVAAQERLIALLAEKRAATIAHAVTKGLDPEAPMKDSGIEWIGQIPAHWITVQLRHWGSFGAGSGFPHEFQGQEGNEFPFHKGPIYLASRALQIRSRRCGSQFV